MALRAGPFVTALLLAGWGLASWTPSAAPDQGHTTRPGLLLPEKSGQKFVRPRPLLPGLTYAKPASPLQISSLPSAMNPSAPSPKDSPGPALSSNSLGMRFSLIKGGGFMMGSTRGDPDEQPVHRVEIKRDFYMQATEVSIAQFLLYLKATGDDTGVNVDYPDCPVEKKGGKYKMKSAPGRFWGDPEQPMVDLNWEAAARFAQWLSQKEGRKYRLPHEAEWEYACRAGSRTKYSFGEQVGRLGEYGWYNRNSGGRTRPVARKMPNPWGLYDMHGNVCEWVQDIYGPYAPRQAGNYPKPDNGRFRVARGGAWYYGAELLRSAYRIKYDQANTCDGIGFRLVREE